MEQILIPMFATCNIEESVPATGIGCKAGDLFLFNPDNELHIELDDSGCFKPIPNSECEFYALYSPLRIGDKVYHYDDLVDVSNVNDMLLDDLILIGYLKKVYNKVNKNKFPKTKNKSNKNNKPKVTYSSLAKELNIDPKQFKQLCLEVLDEKIDMRKGVSKAKEKKIRASLK